MLSVLLLYTYMVIACLPDMKAQIQGVWLDTLSHGDHDMAYFFTNRPMKPTNGGRVDFHNRWTRRSGKLDFCLFDYDKDSILFNYRAAQT